MNFESFGKKIDSFVDTKVKPKVKEIKDSDFYEAKVKPATERAIEKAKPVTEKALQVGTKGIAIVAEKGSEGLSKLADKVKESPKEEGSE